MNRKKYVGISPEKLLAEYNDTREKTVASELFMRSFPELWLICQSRTSDTAQTATIVHTIWNETLAGSFLGINEGGYRRWLYSRATELAGEVFLVGIDACAYDPDSFSAKISRLIDEKYKSLNRSQRECLLLFFPGRKRLEKISDDNGYLFTDVREHIRSGITILTGEELINGVSEYPCPEIFGIVTGSAKKEALHTIELQSFYDRLTREALLFCEKADKKLIKEALSLKAELHKQLIIRRSFRRTAIRAACIIFALALGGVGYFFYDRVAEFVRSSSYVTDASIYHNTSETYIVVAPDSSESETVTIDNKDFIIQINEADIPSALKETTPETEIIPEDIVTYSNLNIPDPLRVEPEVIEVPTHTVAPEAHDVKRETTPRIDFSVKAADDADGNSSGLTAPEGLGAWLNKNTNIKSSSGTTVVSFRVNSSGRPSSIRILSGFSAEGNREVMRVLGEGPKWNPTDQRIELTLSYR